MEDDSAKFSLPEVVVGLLLTVGTDAFRIVADLSAAIPVVGEVLLGLATFFSAITWAIMLFWFVMKLGVVRAPFLIQLVAGLLEVFGIPGQAAGFALGAWMVNHPKVAAVASLTTGAVEMANLASEVRAAEAGLATEQAAAAAENAEAAAIATERAEAGLTATTPQVASIEALEEEDRELAELKQARIESGLVPQKTPATATFKEDAEAVELMRERAEANQKPSAKTLDKDSGNSTKQAEQKLAEAKKALRQESLQQGVETPMSISELREPSHSEAPEQDSGELEEESPHTVNM